VGKSKEHCASRIHSDFPGGWVAPPIEEPLRIRPNYEQCDKINARSGGKCSLHATIVSQAYDLLRERIMWRCVSDSDACRTSGIRRARMLPGARLTFALLLTGSTACRVPDARPSQEAPCVAFPRGSASPLLTGGGQFVFHDWPDIRSFGNGQVIVSDFAYTVDTIPPVGTQKQTANGIAGVIVDARGTGRAIDVPEVNFGTPFADVGSGRRINVVWGQALDADGTPAIHSQLIRAASYDGRNWTEPYEVARGKNLLMRAGASHFIESTDETLVAMGGVQNDVSRERNGILLLHAKKGAWSSEWILTGDDELRPRGMGLAPGPRSSVLLFFERFSLNPDGFARGIYVRWHDLARRQSDSTVLVSTLADQQTAFDLHATTTADGVTHVVWLEATPGDGIEANRLMHAWHSRGSTGWQTEAMEERGVFWRSVDIHAGPRTGVKVAATTNDGLLQMFAAGVRGLHRVAVPSAVVPPTATRFDIVELTASRIVLHFANREDTRVVRARTGNAPIAFLVTLNVACDPL